MEQKRLTLALVLCTLFLIAYSMLMQRTQPPPAKTPTETTAGEQAKTGKPQDRTSEGADSNTRASGEPGSSEGETTPGGENGRESDGEGKPGGGGQAGGPGAHTRDVAEGPSKQIRVETDRFIVELTSRGAVPERVLLKGITTETGLDPSDEKNLLTIIADYQPDRPPLAVDAPDDDTDLVGVDWFYRGESRDGDERVHTFDVAPGNGLRYVKRFRFADGREDIGVDVEVTAADDDVVGTKHTMRLTGASGIVFEGDPTRRMHDETYGIAKFPGHDPRIVGLANLAKQPKQVIADSPEWVAVVSKYFAAILDPVETPTPAEEVSFDTIQSPDIIQRLQREEGLPLETARQKAPKRIAAHISWFDEVPARGQSLEYRCRMYLGLKDRSVLDSERYEEYLPVLKATGVSACGIGFIVQPIASLLFLILKGIHAVTGNWGFAIILLTFFVKLCLFPLTRHQQISMATYQAKMQKHKPELDRIREKYKNNRQKLQQETLKFFKEKGISPIPYAGCLPMFATLPIFFGLFYLLRTAPELRQAPFILWINDLSRPDQLIADWPKIDFFCISIHGLNLLPILMVVAWFIQQRTMPKPQDPQQQQMQQMMVFMPIMFGFFLYDYAAGLSLYWLTNSLFGLVEQRIIRRSIPHLSGGGGKAVAKPTPS